MQKYHETVISSIGRPVIGAAVRVTTLAGAPATIYSDNGITPITSLVTDSTGAFGFYAADGRYNITISGSGFPTRVVTDVLLEDPSGANSVLAASVGSSLVGFVQSGTGAVARTAQSKLRDSVSAKDFGAVGDGTTDDATALQAAINCAIATGATLHIPAGIYKITAPLLIAHQSGGDYDFVSCAIEGAKTTWGTTSTYIASTVIVPTFNDTFGIGIVKGRAIRLKDITVLGRNDFSGNLTGVAPELMTNSTFVINSCRDSRYSPYAGIAVDPFGSSVPSDGGYPGMAAYYVGSVSGSSDIVFDGITVRGFVCGIALAPNGQTANCSEMTFRDCFLEYNKVGLAVCQDQSRSLRWFNGSCAWALWCFDGNNYGAQQGYCPAIYGCNMAGKYLFNIGTRWGNAALISGVHAESFASIGFVGSSQTAARSPTIFQSCSFNFTDFGAGQVADHQLVAYAPVTFIGCIIDCQSSSKALPMRIYRLPNVPITFDACSFSAPLQSEFWLAPSMGFANSSWGEVYFNGSMFNDSSSRGNSQGVSHLSALNVREQLSVFNRSLAPVGATFKENGGTGNIDTYYVGVGEQGSQVSLGSLAISLGANGTATFTATDGTVIRTGDLIYTNATFNAENAAGALTLATAWTCIGIVSAVVGNAVTIQGLPQNLAAGSYSMTAQWWPRFHVGSVGDTTNASTSITNVTNPTTWAVGNKINGPGIQAGAYITAVAGNTLTISKAATATATGVRLYDASLYKLTGTAV